MELASKDKNISFFEYEIEKQSFLREQIIVYN
jgi:hypothetical protein